MNSERPPSSTVRESPRLRAVWGRGHQFGVQLRAAQGAGQGSIVRNDQLGRGRCAVAGLMLPELGRRRIRREWRDDRGPMSTGAHRPACRLDHDGRRDGLHEHVDRAAAGKADVPGFLVADAIADDTGVAGRTCSVDLLGRGALDAAATDRAGDAAVVAYKHRTLGSRRGPKGPNDDGAADRLARRAVLPPCRERVEQFLHRSGLGADGVDGLTTDDGGWSRRRSDPADPATPRVRRLAPRVGCRRPGRHPGSRRAARARDGAGRQEVVDVRIGRAHAAGERLVAGRAGQRVEPDQPVAVPPESGRLGCEECRVAAVPAIRHDDHDARRPE